MTITLKSLIAQVTIDRDADTVTINIVNDEGTVVIGPLTYHSISMAENWKQNINDHLKQLKMRDINIVSLDTTIDGISLN